jgi:hypothetical protein
MISLIRARIFFGRLKKIIRKHHPESTTVSKRSYQPRGLKELAHLSVQKEIDRLFKVFEIGKLKEEYKVQCEHVITRASQSVLVFKICWITAFIVIAIAFITWPENAS